MCLKEANLKRPFHGVINQVGFSTDISLGGCSMGFEFLMSFVMWEGGGIYQWKDSLCLPRSGVKVCRECILNTLFMLRKDTVMQFL